MDDSIRNLLCGKKQLIHHSKFHTLLSVKHRTPVGEMMVHSITGFVAIAFPSWKYTFVVFTCTYLLSLSCNISSVADSVVAGKLDDFSPEDACTVAGLVVDVATCSGNVVVEIAAGTGEDIVCKGTVAVRNGTLETAVDVVAGAGLEFSFPVRPGT